MKVGTTLIQALVWNLGTCRHGEKGEIQVEALPGLEYRYMAQGRNIP